MSELSKKQSMVYHTLKRFKQRFNISLSGKNLKELVTNIKNRKDCMFIFEISNMKKVYIMKAFGLVFGAIYSKKYHSFHTVFPIDWLIDGSFEDNLEKRGLEITSSSINDDELKQICENFIQGV